MSSEAITRNDLKAVLDEVLPPQPSEYRKLLWTNPSPTASFSAQTISLDLSGYDSVELEMDMYTSGTTLNLQTFKGDVGSDLILSADSHTNSVTVTRLCTISSTGIYFGSGWAGTANDQAVIPQKIYGIKYESVAPPQTEYYTPKEFETAWNTHSAGYYTANCVQIGDLKIQWGILQAQSDSFHSVYFKVPFEGLGYYAMASYTSNTDVTITAGNNAYVTGQHTDYCRIRTNGGVYCWLCIGY